MYTSLGVVPAWAPGPTWLSLPDYPRLPDGSVDGHSLGGRGSWNPRETKARNIGFFAGIVMSVGGVGAVLVFKATARKS